MSMRSCCFSDEGKPHKPDCPKQEEWRKRQDDRERETRRREKKLHKMRDRKTEK